ncbi:helix-hairpin-helix domain-containing protein [Niabella hirudinis]|uniref:helix-hairpin-helix domain-containing protein n=1 Tax=Niabella hirudinis TaxID=1285929 RepID=UPI003EB95955
MKAYLKFSKKELMGLCLLLFIVLFFAVVPFVRPHTEKLPLNEQDSALSYRLRTTPEASSDKNSTEETLLSGPQQHRQPALYAPPSKATLFNFDPNTLDEKGWLRLGLRAKTIRTIMNYRSKGGRFRKREDLQKIYGLRPDEFETIRPYIVIAGPQRPEATAAIPARKPGYTRKAPAPVDINTADTIAYKSLYGIGSKLAARIVNYREKLGGFYSISQVGETYGVPDSTFREIRPFLRLDNRGVRKLDINTASYETLNAHPYISSKLAYLIVRQRRAAPINSTEALQALVAQTNDVFEKLEPYVRIEATEDLKH